MGNGASSNGNKASGKVATTAKKIKVVTGPPLGGATDPGFGLEESDNQDSYIVAENPEGEGGGSLLGVFDGFGVNGTSISQRAIEASTTKFQELAKGSDVDHAKLEDLLKEALVEAEAKVVEGGKKKEYEIAKSGCTATLAFVKGKVISIAWVGHIIAYVGRAKGDGVEAFELVQPHLPTVPEEKKRIEDAKGLVKKWAIDVVGEVGEVSVWYGEGHEKSGMREPGIPMSRCIGCMDAKGIGVSSEPSCVNYKQQDGDKFLVICSSGVSRVLNKQKVVETVFKHGTCGNHGAKKLVAAAEEIWLERFTAENTTATVLYFV